jgi:hypothetical protein
MESLMFGLEFTITHKTAVYMVEALRYKLWMMGVPLQGPVNLFCDNKS